MLCITLRGCWYDIIVLNVHAPPTEGESSDTKDSFYKELECVFSQFPKYHIKMFQYTKLGRGDIFKPGNESLHEINRNNVNKIVNFATSKNIILIGRHTTRLITSWQTKGSIQM